MMQPLLTPDASGYIMYNNIKDLDLRMCPLPVCFVKIEGRMTLRCFYSCRELMGIDG